MSHPHEWTSMPFPVRRVLAGFAAGAAAGWFAGLLRTPQRPDPDSSAGAAARLPQREFGSPADAADPLPPGAQEGPDGPQAVQPRRSPPRPAAEPVTEA